MLSVYEIVCVISHTSNYFKTVYVISLSLWNFFVLSVTRQSISKLSMLSAYIISLLNCLCYQSHIKLIQSVFNHFIPEFLNLALQSLNLDRSIDAKRGFSLNQKQIGKQYGSWWDGSLRAVSSGSTLFTRYLFWSVGRKGLTFITLWAYSVGYKLTIFVIIF